MNNIDIITRIGIARQKANLSARALSQMIDMNDGYINRLESKKDFLPSIEVLLKIIEACGMTEEEFFYHNINEFKTDMKLIEEFANISKDKKNAILTLLKKWSLIIDFIFV